MTQEEKTKAYDKALEGIEDYIKSLKNVNDGIWSARDIENSLSEIFPQLKESEDEKVRKTLIKVLNENVGNGIEKYGAKLEDALTWLEKQGEKPQGKTYIFEGKSVLEAINKEIEKEKAFVTDKACRAIEKLLSGYIIRNFNFGDSYDIDRLIEDFKKYMKGE